MQPAIRDARTSDARRFEEIRIAGWKAAYVGLIDADYLERLAVDDERITLWEQRIGTPAPGAVHLAAEQAGDLVGFAALMSSRDDDLPHAAELVALYVDPGRRASGIGGRLMAAGFARMPQPLHVLWTLQGNTAARGFYERRGFVTDGASTELALPGKPIKIRYRRPRLG